MNSPVWVYIIGFAAQIFFAARMLYQWILSEKEKKIVSPSAFWIFSIIGSYLLFVYGVLRNDFAIIFGQIISYYIYLWNLNLKGVLKKLNIVLRIILLITPPIALSILMRDWDSFVRFFFQQKDIPLGLIIFGSAGQLLFTLRFVYQWIYSARCRESQLPIGFWIISLLGSSVIVAYGIFRRDPVLILGQSIGFITYTRNIIIGVQYKKRIAAIKTNESENSEIQNRNNQLLNQ